MTRPPIDISRTIAADTVVYPGDQAPRFARECAIRDGAPANILRWNMNGHVLTHMDAPYHFEEDGATIDEIPLERCMGEALVVAVEGTAVLAEHIPEAAAGLRLLFKTRNSEHWDSPVFNVGHVYISGEAAEAMVARGIMLAGLDYLSVDRFGDHSFPAHHTLLGAGIPILEGLDLGGVEPGRYTLIALPLKIEKGDGSPVRAVLIPLE